MTHSRKWAIWVVVVVMAFFAAAFVGVNPLPILAALTGRFILLFMVAGLIVAMRERPS